MVLVPPQDPANARVHEAIPEEGMRRQLECFKKTAVLQYMICTLAQLSPAHSTTHLCPEALMEATFFRRKSHLRFG